MLKLIEKLPRIEHEILEKNFLFIGLDYDGTLTPIVDHPEKAILPRKTKSLLQDFGSMRNTLVLIISGRSYVDVRKKVGIRRIIYAGNHGMEIKGACLARKSLCFAIQNSKKYKEEIKRICRNLKGGLKGLEGVWIENKGLSASVHYRLANPKDVQKAKQIVFSGVKTFPDLRLKKGKKVWEIRPNIDWDKGKALEYVLQECLGENWGKKASIVYIGDDKTDEDVFSFLKQDGITILVTDNPQKKSKAKYFLKNPAEVVKFLSWLKSVWEEKVA